MDSFTLLSVSPGVEFNLVPVDFAAETIVRITKHTREENSLTALASGRIYHINNFGQATPFDTLLAGILQFVRTTSGPTEAAAANKLERVTYLTWRKRIYASDESNPLFVVRSLFHSWYVCGYGAIG